MTLLPQLSPIFVALLVKIDKATHQLRLASQWDPDATVLIPSCYLRNCTPLHWSVAFLVDSESLDSDEGKALKDLRNYESKPLVWKDWREKLRDKILGELREGKV